MRRRWLVLILSVLALATACAGVPNSSEPVSVRHVDAGDELGDNPDVQAVPRGPTAHMDSREIVQGFLQASTTEVDTGHQVARRFLTPAASAQWQDTAQSTVYGELLIDEGAGVNKVSVSIVQSATVAQDGSYHPNRRHVTHDFLVTKVKGEWRIVNPPPGIYVTTTDFSQNFRSADIYFLTPSRNAVVPDPRFFEVPSPAMANRLMQALLAGPSQWLMPAVVTDVPRGTTLRNAVVDDTPTLTVDLGHLGSMGKSQLKGMSAQIVYTLAKYNSTAVRILSNGQPLAVPGVQTDQQLPDWQSYDAEALPASAPLYVVRDGSVWTDDGKRVPGGAGRAFYDLASVAVPIDGTKMAGVSHRDHEDQLFLGPNGGTLAKRLTGRSLTPPTWGGQSAEVWTVRNGSEVVRVSAEGNGQGQDIVSPAVSKIAPVTQLRLSRDGTRVAVVGRGGRLYIGRVSRSSDSVTIDELVRLAPGQSGFTDITWSDGDDLIGLAPNSSASLVPNEIAIDGSSRHTDTIDTLPAPPTGVAAASNQLTVVSSKGEMWYLDRTSWTRVPAGSNSNAYLSGQAPAYPD